jgi:malate dehydrogenase (oxaloacetate-decarboxylating)
VIVACDRRGAIHAGREGLTDAKAWFAAHTNPHRERGSLSEALAGADVFVGLAGPGVASLDDLRAMAPDPIVFALANPNPEFTPDEVAGTAAVIATGRSDFPNQIDSGLCYPGMFRGAIDVRAGRVTEEMKLAAAVTIAGLVDADALGRGRIVPDIFEDVAPRVARAVAEAAVACGAAPEPDHE